MKSMNSKVDVEREVLETLVLLERPGELPPDPLFYGRVMVRLAEKRSPGRSFLAVLKPVLIVALVVLNVVTAVRFFSGSDRQILSQNRQALIETLAGDLNLANDQKPLFFDE